ncbi:sulfatase-like hydrolase/transferase [Tenacibaculum sp. 190524A02b]|uniref:sulfatase-like hydrolase/transferase n=1 Tax=Tenacibaculum vairaonense TaxID=3137860 RepID=UPI0031FB5065
MRRIVPLFLMLVVLISCKENAIIESIDADSVKRTAQSSQPNILLIISDDMGVDATPGYTIGNTKPNMPNLQSMIANGVRFTNMWSTPTCTPTRASILTGKYGSRTGVMRVGDVLSTSETSLQSYLDNQNSGYSSAVIGKWHLARSARHPGRMGVSHYAGLLKGGVQSYWDWTLTENGSQSTSNEYITSKFTDLAIDWVQQQNQPWFLWLAYTAPHTPYHLPPSNLHYQGSLPSNQSSINANPTPYYMAAIEAMDTEIGRLLNSMSQTERDNTVIIFVGDNGTPKKVSQGYPNGTKGSLYQGGINVPMVVSGKNVNRFNETDNALLTTTDLFSTIANIAGVNVSQINDSYNFADLLQTSGAGPRNYAFTEYREKNGSTEYTIRNSTHKYISFSNGSEALFDLQNDAFEQNNLLNAPLSTNDQQQLNALKAAANNI